MSRGRPPKPIPGINLNQLSELARTNPEYARMFAGLAQIDNKIKDFVKDIVCQIANADVYYIKTELMAQCYTLYLYNVEQAVTVGASWPLANFLEMCENKSIEMEINTKVRQMILKFGEKNLPTDKIIWIY